MENIKNIPILMYHIVAEKNSIPPDRWNDLYVDISFFDIQMKYLKKKGFTAIDFKDLDEIIGGRKEAPAKPVIITFDDGFKDTFSNVTIILKEQGFKAVFAMVTGDISGANTWDENISDLPEFKVMSKEQIADGVKRGFIFESHSVTHGHFKDRPIDKVINELKESMRHLEEITGQKVITIIYPYGEYTDQVKEAAKETGYLFGCAVSAPTRSVMEDRYALKRVFVKGSDSLFTFKRKLSGLNMLYRGWRRR